MTKLRGNKVNLTYVMAFSKSYISVLEVPAIFMLTSRLLLALSLPFLLQSVPEGVKNIIEVFKTVHCAANLKPWLVFNRR